MDSRKHIDLLVFLVKQLLQLSDLSFQLSHTLLKRLCVAPGECATTELVAGFALEANIGALCATWANAVAAYLLGTASVAGLCYAGLTARPDFDYFHRQYSRHVGGDFVLRRCRLVVRVAGPTRGLLTERVTSRQHPGRRVWTNKTFEFDVIMTLLDVQWYAGA